MYLILVRHLLPNIWLPKDKKFRIETCKDVRLFLKLFNSLENKEEVKSASRELLQRLNKVHHPNGESKDDYKETMKKMHDFMLFNTVIYTESYQRKLRQIAKYPTKFLIVNFGELELTSILGSITTDVAETVNHLKGINSKIESSLRISGQPPTNTDQERKLRKNYRKVIFDKVVTKVNLQILCINSHYIKTIVTETIITAFLWAVCLFQVYDLVIG